MISVVLYGRNDAHGYNLHRRIALSLNCLAEILTDPEDEIVFVDYNTPDELPTVVEALADTLTERTLDLLRVVRVPAALHRERFASRTHLSIVEPVSRNVAARLSNPSNRWLLSTNTDMIFLPFEDRSLSEICRDLPDGYYGLPRFELPEWLWEQLPRSDPRRVRSELAQLGPRLRLNEATTSHEWIRFDAPGDFQLVLRDDFFAIDGFDEEMLLGWHVDSNISRRMFLHRGAIDSLGDRLAGYHCNHNRTPTVYHGATVVANDLDRFFVSVDRSDLPAQRESWGLADSVLAEVPLRERIGSRFAQAVIRAIPEGPPSTSNALEVPDGMTYDSGHVLPFIADSLVVSPPEATIGYLGVNPVLERMLAELAAARTPGQPLAVAQLDDDDSVDQVARIADVFVVDLGLDASLADDSLDAPLEDGSVQPAARIPLVLAALQQLIVVERKRLESGEHPRRLVLVNSATVAFDPYVTANLECSATTPHSRVRRALVKALTPSEVEALETRLFRWSIRSTNKGGRLHVRPGESVRLAGIDDYGGFGEGWAYPGYFGIWTEGTRSELALALDDVGGRTYRLALAIRGICVGPGDGLDVELLVNGAQVESRRFSRRHLWMWWVRLPESVVAAGAADLTLVIREPRSPLDAGWSTDQRPLGILLRAVALEQVRRSQAVTDRLLRAVLYLRATIGFRRHFKRLVRLLRPRRARPTLPA